MNPRTGVLLVNLGTPDKAEKKPVAKYLKQFLLDGRVIDIPYIARQLLVRGIIVPFRSAKSTKAYQKLWTQNGSPLKYFGYQNESLLQQALGEEYIVKLAMRYQNPSISKALAYLRQSHVNEIIIIPLFPQYASATVGSVFEAVMKEIQQWQTIPQFRFINHFYEHPLYVKAFVEKGKECMQQKSYDHIIFSYHGLPERHIIKGDVSSSTCLKPNCCDTIHPSNQYCYKAQCYATSRLLAEGLGIDKKNYTVSFQSRLGKSIWIQPYTEDVLSALSMQGKKSVLVFSPAFVADCLETTIEIGEEYKELFLEMGGSNWDLVPSLNNHPTWIACLKDLVLNPA